MTISALQDINDFEVNAGTRSWPIPNDEYKRNDRIWTLTVHQTGCRYSKDDTHVMDEARLGVLADVGLGYRDRSDHRRYIWIGCKVCGTADIPNEDWKQIGKNSIAAREARERARNQKARRQRAIDAAKREREQAIRDGFNDWIAEQGDVVEQVKIEAEARWVAENPEQAALLKGEDA